MDIKNTSNINFRGTFILKPQNQKIREAIPQITRKGKQIFYDIKNDGDIAFVTQDKYDKRVCEFVENNGTKFEYYPEISTKDGLDDEIPSGLKKLIAIRDNCIINDLKLLKRFIFGDSLHLRNQSKFMTEAINTLRLNVENAKIEINDKGVFIIRDAVKKRTIKSTGFKNGMSYFFVIPDTLDRNTSRYLIGKNGQQIVKEYKTPKEISAFNKAFMNAIKS